jgi:hypothetical protein
VSWCACAAGTQILDWHASNGTVAVDAISGCFRKDMNHVRMAVGDAALSHRVIALDDHPENIFNGEVRPPLHRVLWRRHSLSSLVFGWLACVFVYARVRAYACACVICVRVYMCARACVCMSIAVWCCIHASPSWCVRARVQAVAIHPYFVAVNLVAVGRLFISQWTAHVESRYGRGLQESWLTYQMTPSRFTNAAMDKVLFDSAEVVLRRVQEHHGEGHDSESL